MRRSTVIMLGTLVILAAIVWGAVIWQEMRRPRVVTVPTRLATAPLADSTVTGEFTVTLISRVIAADTRDEIPVAAVRVRTPDQVLDFGGPGFQAQIPANRVSTLTVVAPGYVALEQQLKPHYQRDATLNLDIALEPVDPDHYRPILDDLTAAFSHGAYGLYPRLVADSTRIVVDACPECEARRNSVPVMRYARLPGEVEDWPEWDGFEVAYGVRAHLERRYPDQVTEVLLNAVDVPSSIGDAFYPTQHLVIPWVFFSDNGVVALDLTPLGTDVNPLHSPTAISSTEGRQEVDRQLKAHRQGIPLNQGVPMKVLAYRGKTYYLLAAINVLLNEPALGAGPEYQFLLQGFEIQPATPASPLVFVRGALRGLRIKTADFAQLKAMMQADPPLILQQKPHIVNREGDDDPDLDQVLYDNLDVLYFLVTKLVLSGVEGLEPGPASEARSF